MRSSNIELLRIVSMLLIALHHFSWHGPWPKTGVLSADIAIDILSFGGKLGCNLFVLTTGYFMIKSHFKIRSIIRLVGEAVFYSWTLFVVAYCFGEGISFNDLKDAIFPVATGEYWFVTTFVILCFLVPLLNKVFLAISDNQRNVTICTGFVLFVVLPTFFLSNSYTSNLIWFCYVYYIGAYIRMAETLGSKNSLRGGVREKTSIFSSVFFNPAQLALRCPRLLSVMSIAITFFSMIAINYAAKRFDFSLIGPTYLIGQNMLTTACASFGIFVFFARLKIPFSKIINSLGGSALGVYLIHDNPFVRRELWEMFSPVYDEGALMIVLVGIVASVLIFVLCSSIDIARKALIEKPFMGLVNSKLSSQLDRVDKIFEF